MPLTDAWARRRFAICFRGEAALSPSAQLLVAHLERCAPMALQTVDSTGIRNDPLQGRRFLFRFMKPNMRLVRAGTHAIHPTERPRMFRRALISAAALSATLALAPLTVQAAQAATPLKLDVYNPGAQSMFPVSSELITGQTDAVLIDAQFQRNDAQALVQKIKPAARS